MVRWHTGWAGQSIVHMRNNKLILRSVLERTRLGFVSSGSWERVWKMGSKDVGCAWASRKTGLPVEDRREELRDQPLVIGLELLWIHGLVGFGVEVVRVEGPDGS